MNEQLYSDEAIVGFYQNAFNDEPSAALMRFIGMIRDDYEAMLSMACQTSPSEEATIARLIGNVQQLEAEVGRLALVELDCERLTQANAELAAEVERLKAEGNRYAHRNGESAPPTIEGFYWLHQEGLDGDVVHIIWQAEFRYRGKVDVRAGWIISGEPEHYVDTFADAEWWGPIVPPWEAPA